MAQKDVTLFPHGSDPIIAHPCGNVGLYQWRQRRELLLGVVLRGRGLPGGLRVILLLLVRIRLRLLLLRLFARVFRRFVAHGCYPLVFSIRFRSAGG
jgi:hypothetical protein